MPVQTLNQSMRDDIYRLVRKLVQREVAPDAAPSDNSALIGHCLAFAWHGYSVLKEWPRAPRTIIQAGSAQWPRLPQGMYDDTRMTHFAYEWDPDCNLTRLIRSGIAPVVQRADGHTAISLPEIHVWLGCPETGEIIDFTTGLWPETCKATLGLDWHAPKPPEYFWNFGKRRPDRVNYLPDREAIDCVIAILKRQGRAYP